VSRPDCLAISQLPTLSENSGLFRHDEGVQINPQPDQEGNKLQRPRASTSYDLRHQGTASKLLMPKTPYKHRVTEDSVAFIVNNMA